MSDFTIGLSGLAAAQKALDTIGNNIANAATEGYHRQRIELAPAYSSQQKSALFGGGVDVEGITRMIDTLLEQEILRQRSALESVSQESVTLGSIENVFGELSTEDGGLNAAIDKFFISLQDLSAHPGEIIWQNQIVSDAQSMADQFKTIGEFLNTLEAQIRLEADNAVDSINTLINQIAELNSRIEMVETAGGHVNSISDQRDQCISELSKLIGVQTTSKKYGVVDVSAGGIPLVVGAFVNELELKVDENDNLGISIKDASNFTTSVQGGKIGGLLSLKNEIVSDIHDDLDLLANAIIQQINQYHVQGVGSDGAFTSLTGWTNASGDLADFSDVTSGSIFIRVTNTSTGEITRTEIAVDQSNDSLSDIADAITDIAGVSASVNSSNQLTILADANYEFDFLPAVGSLPTSSTLTGSPPTISVSGIYAGTENDTFTFEVSGSGAVGNGTLQLIVTSDETGDTLATINVGAGYAAGDQISVGETGIKISMGTGDLNDEETFKVKVFGNTDTSGVLAAVGINTFFSGSGAMDMAVSSDISDDPRRVATALGADMTDNANALRMADVKNQAVDSLSSLTCGEFHRQLITDIGQQLSVKKIRQDNLETMIQNFLSRQSDVSGVDINEEAAQLLIFEQMFQAMAKYMNTVNSSISSLMELI